MKLIGEILTSLSILLGVIALLDKTIGREKTELIVTFIVTFAIIVFLLFSPVLIIQEVTRK